MDEKTKAYCRGVMDEVKAAAEELGFGTIETSMEESGGIPTVMIGSFKNHRGEPWSLSCSIIPLLQGETLDLYTQFYLAITEAFPPEKEEAAAAFVRQCNEKFMLGNLLIYERQVCMKHVCAWEPALALDDVIFQRTLACFFRQADAYGRLADEMLQRA